VGKDTAAAASQVRELSSPAATQKLQPALVEPSVIPAKEEKDSGQSQHSKR